MWTYRAADLEHTLIWRNVVYMDSVLELSSQEFAVTHRSQESFQDRKRKEGG